MKALNTVVVATSSPAYVFTLVVLLPSDEAIERLQAAWRGKCARRNIRIQHLQARRIQATFRGHQDRKDFEQKRAFLLRLESDQIKREEWQRRIMRNQR